MGAKKSRASEYKRPVPTSSPAVMVDGLTWRDEWSLPYEGPLTLLWKIAAANALSARELCAYLFGKKLIYPVPGGAHARSLLAPAWIGKAENCRTHLGRIIRLSGLDHFAPSWVGAVASDMRLRYCKACIDQGYQSIFHQIDGLALCPIHNEPLLDSCAACRAPNPRYALAQTTIEHPFSCPHCGAPYGAAHWHCGVNAPLEQGNISFESMGAMEDWWTRLESTRLVWPNLQTWQCGRVGQTDDAARHVAVFSVLRQLAPLTIDTGYCASPSRPFALRKHDGCVLPESRARDIVHDERSRHAAYLAIRHYVHEAVLRQLGRDAFQKTSKLLRLVWDNELLYPIAHVQPLVFGYYLWRHHFESNFSLDSKAGRAEQPLRAEVLSWPSDRSVDIRTWATFAIMSFHAYVQISSDFCEETAGIPSPFDSVDSNEFAQLMSNYRAVLSPRHLSWVPSVTHLVVAGSDVSRDDSIVLVGPAPAGEILSGEITISIGDIPMTVQCKNSAVELNIPTTTEHIALTSGAAAVAIAPLERIQIPASLDGRTGTYRWRDHCGAESATDLDLVTQWLAQYDDRPQTRVAYQAAVERLLNWALVERGKPLSSLDHSDLTLFQEFLADPRPKDRWLCTRGTDRSSVQWRPFSGALSPRTRIYTLSVLHLMYGWLCNTGYFVKSWTRDSVSGAFYETGGSVANGLVRRLGSEYIDIDDWRMVLHFFPRRSDNIQALEVRLALELIYYESLSSAELEGMHIGSIMEFEGIAQMSLPGRSPKFSTIYLLPPVVETLDRFLALRGIGRQSIAASGQSDKGDSTWSSSPLFSVKNVDRLLVRSFATAAKRAQEAGDDRAFSLLSSLQLRQLRHAFDARIRTFGLWKLTGARHFIDESTMRYAPDRTALTPSEIVEEINQLRSQIAEFEEWPGSSA